MTDRVSEAKWEFGQRKTETSGNCKNREGEKNASVLLKKRKEKKKEKKRKKLVHIACFRFVPSPKATVAASWCGFHYLSSIHWTILEPTRSSAAILAERQRSERYQRKWKGRSCSVTAHSVWTESLFAQLDVQANVRFIKVWRCPFLMLNTTCT